MSSSTATAAILTLLLLFQVPHVLGRVISVPNVINSTTTLFLQDYLCLPHHIQSNTIMMLSSESAHNIDQFCLVSNASNVTIMVANLQKPAIIRCRGPQDVVTQGGFGFHNIHSLRVINLRFENCGGIIPREVLQDSLSYPAISFGENQQAVLFLSHCFEVHIENVTITHYHGYAIAGRNVLGDSILKSINISNLYQLETSSNYEGAGSGILFHFLDTLQVQSMDMNSSNSLDISHGTLTSNTNIYPSEYTSEQELVQLLLQGGLGGAGGLTFLFQQLKFSINTTISNSNITQNYGTISGGALVMYINTVTRAFVTIEQSTFDANSVPNSNGKSGAALKILFIFQLCKLNALSMNHSQVISETVNITHSNFSNHRAPTGAALQIYSSAQNVSDIHINIERVTFLHNSATGKGDSIHASVEPATFSTKSLVVMLDSINVEGSRSTSDGSDQATFGALDFVNVGYVTIRGTQTHPSVFQNETNSAVRATSTNIFITGSVVFRNNVAIAGAAIFLLSSSHLFIVEPAHVEFSNNLAIRYGGAIGSESIGGDQCVIQFLGEFDTISSPRDLGKLNISLSFVNNQVSNTSLGAGQSVFAAPIYDCAWYPESIVQVPPDRVYKALFAFPNSSGNPLSEIRSVPTKACFCNVTSDPAVTQCNGMTFSGRLDQTATIGETFPGRTFSIHVAPVDTAEQPVPAALVTKITNPNLTSFVENVVSIFKGQECMLLNYTLLSPENVTVEFEISSIQSSSSNALTFKVDVLECPRGFQLNGTRMSCTCVSIFQERGIECNIQTGNITRSRSQWIGFIDDSPAYAERCPRDYCLPLEDSDINVEDDDFLCIGERMGAICGRCKEGFSLQFGSNHCAKCSNYWLFTIFIYALAGILLVVLLFTLRLTVTTGTINGLVFYAQVVAINSGLIFEQTKAQFLLIFISLLNLDLGFPVCFYDGMNQLAKTFLQFVFPVYIWAIAIGIILASRVSIRISRLTPNAVQVLVTLLYLSYAKLVTAVVTALVPTPLITGNGNHLVWFFDGNIHYFQQWHLVLGLVAIAAMVLILAPFKLSLTAAKWCLKYRRTTGYLKPIIDAFFGCYKDKWRLWCPARLYLVTVMVVLYVTLSPVQPILSLALHAYLVLIFLTFQAYVKPFRSKAINILDLFFMLNFCILAGTTAYLLGGLNGTLRTPKSTLRFSMNIIVVILVGGAFLVFWGIMIYHIVLVTRLVAEKCSCKKNVSKKSHTQITITEVTMDERESGNASFSCRLRESLLDSQEHRNDQEILTETSY